MRLIQSELVLDEFIITKSRYIFIEPEKDNINPKDLFSEYELDIDFMVRETKSDSNRYLVFSNIGINNTETQKSGYNIFVEGISIFSFNEDCKLNEKEISRFLWTSGVSIAIGNLRNYITAMTSYYPMGKYILPSVDLSKLLKTKKEILDKGNKVKEENKKNKN